MSGTTYHLRPARGWLNDPNGMVHHGGRWHVFFQHNPDAPVHHRIAWGHCSSADLVHWREHPVAFRPTPGGPDAFGCWSGVLVPGPERPTVVYSGVVDESLTSTVCLRRGSEDLEVWGEPQVVATTPDRDDVRVMRDPFVLQHAGRRWALVGAGLTDGTPAVLLFDAEDLLAWDYVGIFAAARDDEVLAQAGPADVWECPQLARLPGGEVALVLSLHDEGRLTGAVAVTGELVDEAGHPRLLPRQVQPLDAGTSFYAPQVADDPDEGVWLMGWVREDGDPTGETDQAGCLTLPRRLVPHRSGGCRLELDPRVAAGLPATLETAAAQVISHPELGQVELPPGSRVYVDADVTEIYPAGGVPVTTRHTLPWALADGQPGRSAR